MDKMKIILCTIGGICLTLLVVIGLTFRHEIFSLISLLCLFITGGIK